jgi:hypothetical protein
MDVIADVGDYRQWCRWYFRICHNRGLSCERTNDSLQSVFITYGRLGLSWDIAAWNGILFHDSANVGRGILDLFGILV